MGPRSRKNSFGWSSFLWWSNGNIFGTHHWRKTHQFIWMGNNFLLFRRSKFEPCSVEVLLSGASKKIVQKLWKAWISFGLFYGSYWFMIVQKRIRLSMKMKNDISSLLVLAKNHLKMLKPFHHISKSSLLVSNNCDILTGYKYKLRSCMGNDCVPYSRKLGILFYHKYDAKVYGELPAIWRQTNWMDVSNSIPSSNCNRPWCYLVFRFFTSK